MGSGPMDSVDSSRLVFRALADVQMPHHNANGTDRKDFLTKSKFRFAA